MEKIIGSVIASQIDREYREKQKYEYEQFKKVKCKNCINKDTNLCKITRKLNGMLECVEYKPETINGIYGDTRISE